MSWLGVDLRRMGTALVVFGAVGMVIAALVAVGLLGGAIAARNLDERLTAQQAQLATTLTKIDSSMARAVTTIGNAGTTLSTTSDTLANAGTVLESVAGTAEELSRSIDISILGSRPLASAAARLGTLATDVRGFEGRAATLASNLQQNASDTTALAAEIDGLRTQVSSLSARVAGFEATGELVSLVLGWLLLLGLLAAWLALAGAGCAWFGVRLRRLAATLPADPGSLPPAP